MLKCTVTTPMSSLVWLQFRRQQICSLSPTRGKSGHVRSLATVSGHVRSLATVTHGASKEDFHPRVTVDQAEGLCHRITLHFGRLNIETGALYYCI